MQIIRNYTGIVLTFSSTFFVNQTWKILEPVISQEIHNFCFVRFFIFDFDGLARKNSVCSYWIFHE